MEQTIQKVEEALDNLSCKFVFEKKELHDGVVKYVSPSGLSVSGYGMTFGVGISVVVCRVKGKVVVEYQIAEYFGDADTTRSEVVEKLISNGVDDLEKVEYIITLVLDVLETIFQSMFEKFAEDFEMSLPDVYIVDPQYRDNPSK